jgi:hypothetical protein
MSKISFEHEDGTGELNPRPSSGKQGMLTKLASTSPRAIATIVIIIGIIILWLMNKGNSSLQIRPNQSHSNEIILTTDWHEIPIPVGMTINFMPTDKDIWWDVMINGCQIYHRPPINSPEFKEINYGDHMRLVAWRVSPENPQKTCKFAYSLGSLR